MDSREWRPIKTAPKDGTEVLLSGFHDDDPSKPRWMAVGGMLGGRWLDDGDELFPPTHWMLLPLPPGDTSNG